MLEACLEGPNIFDTNDILIGLSCTLCLVLIRKSQYDNVLRAACVAVDSQSSLCRGGN